MNYDRMLEIFVEELRRTKPLPKYDDIVIGGREYTVFQSEHFEGFYIKFDNFIRKSLKRIDKEIKKENKK